MAGIGNVQISVSTEVLQAKAESAQQTVEGMTRQFEELYAHIEAMGKYWLGTRSQAAMKQCTEDRKNVEEMMRRLCEYPRDLLEIAGVYQEAETETTAWSEPLSSEVIV